MPSLSQLRNVRFLLRPYVGYDDIDVDAVTRHGIVFANVPDAFIEEVANHTLALILAGNRKLLQNDAFVKSGRLVGGRPQPRGSRAHPATVGADARPGRLRQHRPAGRRARPAVRLQVPGRRPVRAAEVAAAMGVSLVSIDELLAESDIVSLHVFLNAQTRGMIDARAPGADEARRLPGQYVARAGRRREGARSRRCRPADWPAPASTCSRSSRWPPTARC